MAPHLELLPHDPPPAGQADADCVRRVRGGDEQAFESVFHEYYAVLCVFAERYVGARDVAEELVQQIFVSIWQSRGTWFVRTGLRAYLFQATRNRCLNHLKHERVRRGFVERMTLETRPGTRRADGGPEQHYEYAELADAVTAAINRLADHYREPVQLRVLEQMTHPEIAIVLDLPTKTVETRVRRGLQTLRRMLRPHF